MIKRALELASDLVFRLERNAILAKRADGKFILRTEKRLMASCRRVWQKQLDYILVSLKSVSAFKENSVDTNAIDDEISRIANNLPHKSELVDDIILHMKSGMLKGGTSAVQKLNLAKYGISFSLENKKAIDFLNAKKSLELSNYRGNIHATTKANIVDILTKAAKSGQSYQKTAQLIVEQGRAGVFSPARAQMIATREVGVAYEKGNNIPTREFQTNNPERVVQKYWQTVDDDRVTEECAANEAEGWIGLEQQFSSGDDYAPREGNPRCRCFTKYEIK